MNENGKAISDKDKDIIGELIGSLSKKKKVPSPTPMPAKIKKMRADKTAADKARRDSRGADKTAPLEQMKYGGKVKGYQNGGCVMAGRGGKFKGIS